MRNLKHIGLQGGLLDAMTWSCTLAEQQPMSIQVADSNYGPKYFEPFHRKR